MIVVTARKPATIGRVRMVPPDAIFHSTSDSEQLDHLLLVNGVDAFDWDAARCLGHGEDVDNFDGVVINDIANQETHDLEGNACPRMLFKNECLESTFNILINARDEIWICSAVSGMFVSG
jgi:hypothetical protein